MTRRGYSRLSASGAPAASPLRALRPLAAALAAAAADAERDRDAAGSAACRNG